MESQMYGTPVIGAAIGGIPELVQEGINGELFESGNATDLKKKIEVLWQDEERLQKYSKNCKKIQYSTIEEYCGWLLKIL